MDILSKITDLDFLKNTIIFEDNGVKITVIFFEWLQYILKVYFTKQQIELCTTSSSIPEDVKKEVNDASYASLVEGLLLTSFTTFTYLSSSTARTWNYIDSICDWDNEILESCAWFLVVDIFSTLIILPFKFYGTYFLRRRHNVGGQWSVMIRYQITSFILKHMIKLPITALLLYLINNYGSDYFFIWCAVSESILVVIHSVFFPTYYYPLVYSYNVLPAGDLKNSITNLAQQINFNLKHIYVVGGSSVPGVRNPCLIEIPGLETILLCENLIKPDYGYSNEEILALVAQKFGHWNHNHLLKGFCIEMVNIFIKYYTYSAYNHDKIYETLGFGVGERPVLPVLLFFTQYVKISNILCAFDNLISNQFVYQADDYAVQLGKSSDFKSCLIRLNRDNLMFSFVDPFYLPWLHPYPQLPERLSRLT